MHNILLFLKNVFTMPPLCSVAPLIVPSLFLILFVCTSFLFFLFSLTGRLSPSSAFSKNHIWTLQIIACWFSSMLISDVIFLSAFLLFPWALFCWGFFPLTSSGRCLAHCSCFKILANSLTLFPSEKWSLISPLLNVRQT